MPSTKPHLPKNVLKKLLELPMMKGSLSATMTDNFDRVRLAIIKHDLGIDGLVDFEVPGPLPDGGKRTCLEFAALTGDLILAYEMIRLGATIETKDSDSQTAVHLAYQRYFQYRKASRMFSKFVHSAHDVPPAGYRCREIARVLVEQHASLDVGADEDPPKLTILHLACAALDWEFIELLLHHGARDTPDQNGRLITQYMTQEQRDRYNHIISTAPTERPPRTCPCWSGKTLAECHAKHRQPYPAEFLCLCGSGKTFKRCCLPRNRSREEFWNADEEWIQSEDTVTIPLHVPEAAREAFDSIFPSGEPGSSIHVPFNSEVQKTFDRILDEDLLSQVDSVVQRNLIDPAFAYAVKSVGWVPKPLGGPVYSKTQMEFRAGLFNDFVDEYIGQGTDKRPKLEIERAAKMRPSCGALYKVCEAKQCDLQEGGDIAPFKRCGKCRLTFYCSSDCQKADWKHHKKICGSHGQVELPLPSQQAFERYIMNPYLKSAKGSKMMESLEWD
ncbi:hypothetical protein BD410DRAFT_838248 [Rickenella mellea]|uniref:MYND-type domain-containing protein n=1 Tax=Rickenella mellea TaxID=50990 RepID=A0A4Y7QA85_9AGAM|nr:hypothetical protein BD410DRAFT_838248 [Rickenella mellea]